MCGAMTNLAIVSSCSCHCSFWGGESAAERSLTVAAPYRVRAARLSKRALSFIDYNHSAFDYDFRLQPIPIALQRIAVDQNDIGQLARLQRSKLTAHLDIRRGIRPHDLNEVLHREHQI